MGSHARPENDPPAESGVDETSGSAEASSSVPAEDAAVEIPAELKAEIRRFARGLVSMNYYEVLGVPRDVDEGRIRAAFFERSKLFHPDRYFNKQLGVYQELLTEIYKRVVVAHEVLGDKRMRSDYDKRLDPPRRASAAKGARSLRSRRGLRSPKAALLGLEKQVEAGRQKAFERFKEGLLLKEQGDWKRAAELVRLALALDPREKRFQDVLADLLPRVHAEQVADLRRKAEVLVDRKDVSAALPFLEDAAQLEPTNAALACQVAAIALELGDIPKASEYAERAVSLDEAEPGFRLTLGRVYRAAGDSGRARKQFQRAWELDPLDVEIKAELSRP